MKKTLILIYLTCLISSCQSLAQEVSLFFNDIPKEVLDGARFTFDAHSLAASYKVDNYALRSVMFRKHSTLLQVDSIKLTAILEKEGTITNYIVHFNEQGKILLYENLDNNIIEYSIKYNEKEQVIEEYTNMLKNTISYEYDEKDMLKYSILNKKDTIRQFRCTDYSIAFVDEKSSYLGTTFFYDSTAYNNDGQCVYMEKRSVNYSKDTLLTKKYINYNERQQIASYLTETRQYDTTVKEKHVYVYNDYQFLIKKEVINNLRGNHLEEHNYVWTKRLNNVIQLTYTISVAGMIPQKYVYTFDKYGSWLSETSYNQDGIPLVTWKRELYYSN